MVDDSGQDRLSNLLEEYIERRRRGESPSIAEYVKTNPDLAEEIREIFSAAAAMEGLKPKKRVRPSHRMDQVAMGQEPIGEFRIIREIGRGGMGVVFEADQESLDRRVALKILPKWMMTSDSALKRFHREAHLAARLQHPNIVPIHGVGESGDHHWIAMQLIFGLGWDRLIAGLIREMQRGSPNLPENSTKSSRFLLQLTRRFLAGKVRPSDASDPASGDHRPRPGGLGVQYLGEAAGYGVQAALALDFAHQQGVWHRDVKPANLLLDMTGRVWVTDFGLAKGRDSEDITTSNHIFGTIRFMAPEQFDGMADARSDIYSLGLSLYELMLLRPGFFATSQSVLIRKILQGSPRPPRQVDGDFPQALEAILLKAVARDPRDRYQSARDLARDLKRFQTGQPPLIAFSPPVQARAASDAWGWKKLSGWGLVFLFILFLAFAAGTGISNWIFPPQNRPSLGAPDLSLQRPQQNNRASGPQEKDQDEETTEPVGLTTDDPKNQPIQSLHHETAPPSSSAVERENKDESQSPESEIPPSPGLRTAPPDTAPLRPPPGSLRPPGQLPPPRGAGSHNRFPPPPGSRPLPPPTNPRR